MGCIDSLRKRRAKYQQLVAYWNAALPVGTSCIVQVDFIIVRPTFLKPFRGVWRHDENRSRSASRKFECYTFFYWQYVDICSR